MKYVLMKYVTVKISFGNSISFASMKVLFSHIINEFLKIERDKMRETFFSFLISFFNNKRFLRH